jgi:hypothetical protein
MKQSACERTRGLLLLWLGREADHSTWEAQAAHVARCVDCAKLVLSHASMWAELGEWADASVPPELDRTVRAAARRECRDGA